MDRLEKIAKKIAATPKILGGPSVMASKQLDEFIDHANMLSSHLNFVKGNIEDAYGHITMTVEIRLRGDNYVESAAVRNPQVKQKCYTALKEISKSVFGVECSFNNDGNIIMIILEGKGSKV